jgi:hypothetical protein
MGHSRRAENRAAPQTNKRIFVDGGRCFAFGVGKRIRKGREVSKKDLGGVAFHFHGFQLIWSNGVPIRDIFDYFSNSDLITSLTPDWLLPCFRIDCFPDSGLITSLTPG